MILWFSWRLVGSLLQQTNGLSTVQARYIMAIETIGIPFIGPVAALCRELT